ncbi:MAG: GAF domain-containing protein, partial [Planctomycetota bacterium]
EALVTMHTIREEDGGRWLCLSNEDPRGIVRQEHKSLPVPAPSEDGSGVVVWVAETGRAVFIENLLTVPEHWRRRFIELKPGVRSEIAVPLYSPDRNRVAGVLNVETPVIGSLTSEKTYYLMAFAQQAERTLEQARRVRQRERELADIARAVGHLRRPQAAEGDGATQPLDELCSRICSISGSWAADIWVRDLDGNRAVNVGRCNIDFGQEDCPRPDGRTVWLLKRPDDCSLIMRFRDDDPRRVDRPQSRKLVRARGGAGWHQEPFPEEDDLNQQNPAAVAHAIRQEVAVPLTYGSERLAVLFVKFRELVPLNDPRLRKLLLLADLAAIALGTREPGRQSEAAGQSGGR